MSTTCSYAARKSDNNSSAVENWSLYFASRSWFLVEGLPVARVQKEIEPPVVVRLDQLLTQVRCRLSKRTREATQQNGNGLRCLSSVQCWFLVHT